MESSLSSNVFNFTLFPVLIVQELNDLITYMHSYLYIVWIRELTRGFQPILSTPGQDHCGYSRSMFLECAADGMLTLINKIFYLEMLMFFICLKDVKALSS